MAEDIQFPIVEGQTFYTFTINTPGDYIIWGRVSAPDASSDSLFLMIDGDTLDRIWVLERTELDKYVWDAANERGGADPIVVNFTAGSHSISIRPREQGSKISTIILSNDPARTKPNTWRVIIEFSHSEPSQVEYFNLYFRRMDQDWREGYIWRVENTMTAPDDVIEFETPDVPANVFYCVVATAVRGPIESDFPLGPNDLLHTGWDCMFVKPEDMGFGE